jgi:hypothetical protein
MGGAVTYLAELVGLPRRRISHLTGQADAAGPDVSAAHARRAAGGWRPPSRGDSAGSEARAPVRRADVVEPVVATAFADRGRSGWV